MIRELESRVRPPDSIVCIAEEKKFSNQKNSSVGFSYFQRSVFRAFDGRFFVLSKVGFSFFQGRFFVVE